MNHRFALRTGAAAITILLVTACSDPTTAPTASNSSTGAPSVSGAASDASWPATSTKLDGVNITIWTAQSTSTVPTAVITAFEAKTGAKVTNVTVPDQYETNVQTKIATGDKPDLMLWQATGSELAAIKASTDLQRLDGAPWIKLLNKPSQQIGVVDGIHYAAPIKAPSVIGVYYNKKDFAKAGITIPPVGYDGLLAAAKKLKAAGIPSPVYEAAADRWPTQWCVQTQLADLAKSGFWDRLNKNKDSFENPAVIKAITDCKNLYQQYGNANINTAKFVDQGDALMSGDAGMVIQVNALMDEVSANHTLKQVDDTVGFFPISPQGNTGTVITEQTNTVVAFKTGDATREAATRQFLEFWLQDYYSQFITKQGYVSLETTVPSPDTIAEASKANVANAVKTVVGSMQNDAIVNPDLYLNMVDLYAGKKTPEQVAQVTQAQFVQVAKALGAGGF